MRVPALPTSQDFIFKNTGVNTFYTFNGNSSSSLWSLLFLSSGQHSDSTDWTVLPCNSLSQGLDVCLFFKQG